MLVAFEQYWLTPDTWPPREVGSASIQGAAIASLSAGRIFSTNGAALGAATSAAVSSVRRPSHALVSGFSNTGMTTKNIKHARANVVGRALHNSPVPTMYRIVYGGFGVVGKVVTDFQPKAVWAAGGAMVGVGQPQLTSIVLNIAYGFATGRASSYVNAHVLYAMEASILGAAYIVPLKTSMTLNAQADVEGRAQYFISNRVRLGARAAVTNNSTASITKSSLRKSGKASVIGKARSTPNMLAVVNGEATGRAIGRGRARLRPSWVYSMPELTLSGTATANMNASVKKPVEVSATARGQIYANAYVRRGATASVVAKAVGQLDSGAVYSMAPTEIVGRAPSYNLRTIVRKTSEASVMAGASATLSAGLVKCSKLSATSTGSSSFINSIVRNIAKGSLVAKAVLSLSTTVEKITEGTLEAISHTNLVSSVLRPASMEIEVSGTIIVDGYVLKIMEADLTGNGDIALTSIVINNATMEVVAVSVMTADTSVTYAAGSVVIGEGNAGLKARRYRKSTEFSKPISVIRVGRRFKRN